MIYVPNGDEINMALIESTKLAPQFSWRSCMRTWLQLSNKAVTKLFMTEWSVVESQKVMSSISSMKRIAGWFWASSSKSSVTNLYDINHQRHQGKYYTYFSLSSTHLFKAWFILSYMRVTIQRLRLRGSLIGLFSAFSSSSSSSSSSRRWVLCRGSPLRDRSE